MKRLIAASAGHKTVMVNDNLIMTGSAASPLRTMLKAPFTRRAWTEVRYTLITLPLALAAAGFTAAFIGNGPLWSVSADGVRRFGAVSRHFARELLGEDVPPPPRLRPVPGFKIRTPDAERLAQAAAEAKGRARVWETKPGVTVRRLPRSQVIELAAEAGIAVQEIRPTSKVLSWMAGRIVGPATWRARCYIVLKLPLAVAGALTVAGCWLGGLFFLMLPVKAVVAQHKPDIAIVDVRMPPGYTDEGLRAAIAIRHDHPGVGILVFSQYIETRYAADLLAARSGGVGYLLKDRVANVAEFTEAIARVAAGGTALDPEVVRGLLNASRHASALAALAAREHDVLALMAEGRSNSAIADRLIVSERAVEKHISNIFTKLGLPPSDSDHRRVLAVLAYLGT